MSCLKLKMAIKMCESLPPTTTTTTWQTHPSLPTVFLCTVLESGETLNMTVLFIVLKFYQSNKHAVYSQWVPMGT